MAAQERILVVESDPSSSDFMSRVLRSLGYEVEAVHDASDAIRQVSQFSPDLILTNLNLPGLSGKDLLVALGAQAQPAPVILMAPRGQENAVIQAFRLGAVEYLPLPARETEIATAVERALQQVHERRDLHQLEASLEETRQHLEHQKREFLQPLCREVERLIRPATIPLELLLTGRMGTLTPVQQETLKAIQTAVQQVIQIVSGMESSASWLPAENERKQD